MDSCRGQQIDGLDEEFKSLEILSLINVGLTTLRGFPKLVNLKKLELSDNRIMNGLDNLLNCGSLTHLNLSGNKIKDFEVLGPLAKLQNFTNLDLFNCDITQSPDYRTKIFKLLPNLKYLDGMDVNGEEEEEDDFDGNDSEEGDEDDDEEDGEGEEDEDDDDEEGDEDDDDDEDDDEENEEEDQDLAVSKKKILNGVNGQKSSNTNGHDEEDDDDDDDDDEDEVDEDDDDEDEGTENEVGLSYLQKENLDDDENDEDFDEEKARLANNTTNDDEYEDEEEEDNLEMSKEENFGPRKRKHEDTGDEDSKTQ